MDDTTERWAWKYMHCSGTLVDPITALSVHLKR